MEPILKQPTRALVADIGGTNARFAIADLSTSELSHIVQFPCSNYSGPAAAIHAYLEQVGQRPAYACLAVAAPVTDEMITFTNSNWSFTKTALCQDVGFEEIVVLNDFQALALALPKLRPHELHQIGGDDPPIQGTKVVLGAGTGIGVAGLVWSSTGWVPVPSEGGHITLACRNAAEFALTDELRTKETHIPVERLVSGPGIADLYSLIASSRGPEPQHLIPHDVLTHALAGTDEVAVETLRLFVNWFGSFAGDAALLLGARGGVYVGGGIAPKILPLLCTGAFRQAFEGKGRMQHYLQPIPIYVLLAEYATLRGAAVCLRNELRPARD
jgi:glucokinase